MIGREKKTHDKCRIGETLKPYKGLMAVQSKQSPPVRVVEFPNGYQIK